MWSRILLWATNSHKEMLEYERSGGARSGELGVSQFGIIVDSELCLCYRRAHLLLFQVVIQCSHRQSYIVLWITIYNMELQISYLFVCFCFSSSIFGISSSTEVKTNQAVQCTSVLHANLVLWSFNNWNINVVIRFGNIVPQKYGSTLLSELRMNFVGHKISPQETYVYYDTMYSLFVTTR